MFANQFSKVRQDHYKLDHDRQGRQISPAFFSIKTYTVQSIVKKDRKSPGFTMDVNYKSNQFAIQKQRTKPKNQDTICNKRQQNN